MQTARVIYMMLGLHTYIQNLLLYYKKILNLQSPSAGYEMDRPLASHMVESKWGQEMIQTHDCVQRFLKVQRIIVYACWSSGILVISSQLFNVRLQCCMMCNMYHQ